MSHQSCPLRRGHATTSSDFIPLYTLHQCLLKHPIRLYGPVSNNTTRSTEFCALYSDSIIRHSSAATIITLDSFTKRFLKLLDNAYNQHRRSDTCSTPSIYENVFQLLNTMSAPPNDGYGQSQQPEQVYQDQPGQVPETAAGGKKKKRAYAAGAFDVGSGANATVGGQPVGAQYGMPAPAGPAYGSYAEPQQPLYGAQPGMPQQPAYGQPQPYPDQTQPPQGVAPNVGDITHGMANMNTGGAPMQPAQMPQQPSRPSMLNTLYPTDLLSNAFNVAELDLPPPPIVLPSNVSAHATTGTRYELTNNYNRLALPRPKLPTARRNTSARPLMPSLPPAHFSKSRNFLSHSLSSLMAPSTTMKIRSPSFRIRSSLDADDAELISTHMLASSTMVTAGAATCVT